MLTTKEVITTILQFISATTKMILTTEEEITSTFKII